MLRWSTMQLRSWCAAQLQQQPGWARCRQICWRASAARAQTSHAAACCGVDEDESCNVLVRRRRGGGGGKQAVSCVQREQKGAWRRRARCVGKGGGWGSTTAHKGCHTHASTQNHIHPHVAKSQGAKGEQQHAPMPSWTLLNS